MLYLYKILYLGHEKPGFVFHSQASNEAGNCNWKNVQLEKVYVLYVKLEIAHKNIWKWIPLKLMSNFGSNFPISFFFQLDFGLGNIKLSNISFFQLHFPITCKQT